MHSRRGCWKNREDDDIGISRRGCWKDREDDIGIRIEENVERIEKMMIRDMHSRRGCWKDREDDDTGICRRKS